MVDSMNDKNIGFYNNLGVEPFKKLSEIGGFSSHIDLEIIYPHIKDSKSIVELGAGYGRCLDYFIDKGFHGKLIAVEKAKPYLDYLKKNYSHKAEILDKDIKKLELPEKVDTILWMFSGIIDFSPEEQMEVLKRLNGLLNEKGKLAIDIPKLGFQTYADHSDEQHLKFESEYGLLECYIPSWEDMTEYQVKCGFSHVIRLGYKTTTEKERTIYILSK